MQFIPIVIPTLNRYEHLQKCLKSLSRCTWADQTEVFVALDYPPSSQWEKYAPGWEKNRDWLRSIGNFGFKKLHLIERDYNYGIWSNSSSQKTNCAALIDEYIDGKFKSYIYTEDDNIFSPCFLEYMNKGYELFKKDPKVVCISGYRFYFPIKADDNTFFRQTVDYAPWGCMRVGLNRIPKVDYHWFRNHLSVKTLFHLHKRYGMGAVCSYMSLCSKMGNINPVDRHFWTYMQVMGYEQITPVVNLVQNIGLDGSGERADSRHEEWTSVELNPISKDQHFDFIGTGYEYFDENNKIYYKGKYWMTEWQYFLKTCKKTIKFLSGR